MTPVRDATGRRPARRRRVARAVCAVLALLTTPAPSAAPGAGSVVLTGVTPAVPGPDDTVSVTGAVVGGGQRAPGRVGVRVDGGAVVAGHSVAVTTPGAGERVPFTVRVPVSALGLPGTAGVHRLTVTLAGADGGVLAETGTELPWAPPGSNVPALRTAVFWPVADRPHMQAVSLGEGQAAQPVFRDDALATDLGTAGRLGRVVAAGRGLDVTWTVDPGLLDEAAAMSRGYRVADRPDGADPRQSREGTGADTADAWLRTAADAVRGRTVDALPYADPDLASLAHRERQGVAGPPSGVLAGATTAAGPAVADALRTKAAAVVAWPYRGALDSSVTALAGRLGLRTVLASGRGLGTGSGQPRASLAGGTTVWVGDPATDTTLTRDLGGEGGVVSGRQELLGDLLRAALRGPGGPGGVVVLPPRRMPGEVAEALAGALRAAQGAGWLALSGPEAVASGGPETSVAGFGRASAGSAGELPAAVLSTVRATGPDLATLTRVLADPTRTTDAVHRAMLRALSTGWRGDPHGAEGYASGLEDYLDRSIASVRLLPRSGAVTVTGGSASLPVTVSNGLQQPLAGLVLRVTSGAVDRLTVGRRDTPVTVPAAASHTERVRVSALRNGPADLTARLITAPDGKPWGAPVTVKVEVNKVSLAAVAVVLAAVAALALAGALRMRRARRRRG